MNVQPPSRQMAMTTVKMMNTMKSYDDDEMNLQRQPAHGLSAASLRRLSWRRHLAAAKMSGRTFSLQDKAEQVQRNDAEGERGTSDEKRTLLAGWIDSSAETRLLVDAEASWSRLSSKRGKYGETLLHILLIIQQQQHQQRGAQQECLILVAIICHLFPLLVNDVFESQKFAGLNCLHLTVAYGEEQLLDYLLSLDTTNPRKPLIEGRVTGSLFGAPSVFAAAASAVKVDSEKSQKSPFRWLRRNERIHPQDKQETATKTTTTTSPDQYWCDRMVHWPTASGHAHLLLSSENCPANNADSGGGGDGGEQATSGCGRVYLGDSPLAWSVSLDKRTMFESLLAKGGANLQACDRSGHSCLHMLVINNQTSWARFLIKSGLDPALPNSQGQTAFLMACRLGRAQLFDEFLDLTAVEFWSYSMIRCCGYPLSQLDSIQRPATDETPIEGSARRRQQSAMGAILESDQSSDEQKSQLLSSAVVKKLLEEKWRLFARRLFYNDLLLALLHLLLLSVSITLRPVARNKTHAPIGSDLLAGNFSRIDRTRLVSGQFVAVAVVVVVGTVDRNEIN